MAERYDRKSGSITDPGSAIPAVNNLSFQNYMKNNINNLPQSHAFRDIIDGNIRIDSFGKYEKVHTKINDKKEKKSAVSYLLLPDAVNVTKKTWPAGNTYEYGLSLRILDVNNSGVKIINTITKTYQELIAIVGSSGNLGFLTYSSGIPCVWCDQINKFIIMINCNFDTENKTALVFMDMNGNITGDNTIWTRPWISDYSTLFLKSTNIEVEGGVVISIPYIIRHGYPDVLVPPDSIMEININSLSVDIRDIALDRTVILHSKNLDVTIPRSNFTHQACYFKSGMLVNDGESTQLKRYNKAEITSPHNIIKNDINFNQEVAFIRNKNLIYLQGYVGISPETSASSYMMDLNGNILYHFNPLGTDDYYTTSGSEMLRRAT